MGGVLSRVGGVEASDKPDEPAVDGLPSTVSTLLDVLFLRCGTPSGHVHLKMMIDEYSPRPSNRIDAPLSVREHIERNSALSRHTKHQL